MSADRWSQTAATTPQLGLRGWEVLYGFCRFARGGVHAGSLMAKLNQVSRASFLPKVTVGPFVFKPQSVSVAESAGMSQLSCLGP